MEDYYCTVCNHLYDPKLGDPENGVAPNTPFEQLPETWICPICGEAKWAFASVTEGVAVEV
ncbi:MAG: rubredoxin [Rikenellaceae bacterium]